MNNRKERTKELVRKAKSLDPQDPETERLLWEVVLLNEGLARRATRLFSWPGDDEKEVFQIAMMGLRTAAIKYDPDRGSFSSVADWYMRTAIQRNLHTSKLQRKHLALDEPFNDSPKSARLIDLLATQGSSPEEDARNSLRSERVRKAVAKLPKHLQKVVELRYGFEDGELHTYNEVGKSLGSSGEWARKQEKEARDMLKETLTTLWKDDGD